MAADPMRTVSGGVVLPADVAPGAVGSVRVELRDVSQQDAPSLLLAAVDLDAVALAPGARIPFELRAPAAGVGRSLSLRVQVDARSQPGVRHAYLSTQSFPVPPAGDVGGLEVGLTRI